MARQAFCFLAGKVLGEWFGTPLWMLTIVPRTSTSLLIRSVHAVTDMQILNCSDGNRRPAQMRSTFCAATAHETDDVLVVVVQDGHTSQAWQTTKGELEAA